MPVKKRLIRSPRAYWEGKGRKIVMIPNYCINKFLSKADFFKTLYITDIGYYPKAVLHHIERENGSPENILFFCVAGNGWVETKQGRFTVSPNQFFILPRNEKHAYSSSFEKPWSIYWAMFSGDLNGALNVKKIVQECASPYTAFDTQKIVDFFDEMFDVLNAGFTIQNLISANMELWMVLILFMKQRYKHGAKEMDSPIKRVICYMKDNIEKKISINDMAERVLYSPSYLFNLFKSQTGYSPMDYFIHLKVQYACQQLNQTNLRIKEIAASVGYDDPYLFTRIFTRLMGQSPKKYRLTIKV